MPQRFDVGTLGNAEKTPTGGFRVPAHLTRAGIFEYQDSNGKTIREYRPPDEVFAADSLATLPDAPVTVGHPGLVTPDNHSKHAAGHVRDVKQDNDRIAAVMVLQDRTAIRAVEKGVRQVSCGYACRVDEAPGMTPSGQHYDRVQREIRYNHVALVDQGRAGPDIRLRLDGAGNQLTERADAMEYELIEDTKYEVGTDAHRAAVKRREDAKTVAQARADALAADLAKATARADAADADKAKLATRIAELENPARLDAAVLARAALVDAARSVLGAEVKLDGVSDLEIRRQVAAKVYPTIKLDGADAVRVDALYEAALASVQNALTREDAVATQRVRAAVVTPGVVGKPVDIMRQAREDQLTDSTEAWRQVAPYSPNAKEA